MKPPKSTKRATKPPFALRAGVNFKKIFFGYRKDVNYFIEMVGMASDCVGNVSVDSKYALIQLHPTYTIAIAPQIGTDRPTFEEAVFYRNCLAYEHDLPAIIFPVKRKALAQPIKKRKERGAKYINDLYHENLCVAYEGLNSIKLGPLGYVYFRWPGFDREIDLPYTTKYSKVAKELSLYSAAIRQLDPLSEFLNYYRVIESVSSTNGYESRHSKDWISKNLSRLVSYKFGFLEFGSGDEPRKGRRTNVFNIYRKRALTRLRNLKNKLVEKSVADYFYHENRCGIAHGTSKVKVYDFDVREILEDTYILKLLSRVAIEDKLLSL